MVIGTGLLLQVKKEFPAIQPPTARGGEHTLSLDFETILAQAKTVPELGVESWEDVDRLDVRPGPNIVKVRGKNHWEVQLDASNGNILQSMPRHSDLIESLHDGSWFHRNAKLWLFLPSGILTLVLWATGLYLWFLPKLANRRKRRSSQRCSTP